MVLIRVSEVPRYLQNGSLFASFDLSDSVDFEVPDECFKRDTIIKNGADLVHLFRSLRFWLVDDIPIECFIYVIGTDMIDSIDFMHAAVSTFEPQLIKYTKIRETELCNRIATAITLEMGVDAVRCLHGRGCVLCEDDCVAAAYRNDLHSLKYLREHNCAWNERTIIAAIVAGHIDCLHYAIQHNCPHAPDQCCEIAVIGGHIEVLEYLLNRGMTVSKNAVILAVKLNRLDCLKKMHEAEVEWPPDACYYAVLAKNLSILKYLHEHGCPWSGTSAECNVAVSLNQLEILVYLHTHGAAWDADTLQLAAEKGHAACLKYARQRGCEVGFHLLGAAVVGRNWACFWYAMFYGQPVLLNVTAMSLGYAVYVYPLSLREIYSSLRDLRPDSSIVFLFLFLALALSYTGGMAGVFYLHFAPYLSTNYNEDLLVDTMLEVARPWGVAAACSLVTCVLYGAVLYFFL